MTITKYRLVCLNAKSLIEIGIILSIAKGYLLLLNLSSISTKPMSVYYIKLVTFLG